MLLVPVGAILPNVYAKNTAVSLAAIGMVMVVTRVFDAISDQLVGYYSDLTHSRLGARLPWMIVGVPFLMISAYYLFSPPGDAGVAYFATWSLLFYLAYTIIFIPYLAWGSELSGDYNERSRIFAWHGVASQVGGFFLFGAPVLLFALGMADTTEFGAQQMRIVGLVAVLVLPLLMVFTVLRGPKARVTTRKTPDFRGLLETIRCNRPLQLFVLIYLISVIGHGAFGASIIIFLDSYFGLGTKLPYIFICLAVVQILSVYPWTRVIYRYGKHKPWALSWVASALILPLLMWVDPQGAQALWWVLAILLAQAFVEGLSNIAPGAVLADIVDYEILRSGADRAGNFYAFQNFVIKSAAALGAGLAFLMLDAFGYDVKDPSTNDQWAHAGIFFTALLFPAAMKLSSAALVWYFPIDARRQGIIRRRIESLANRDERDRQMAKAS